jgi:hypothetical protein
MFRGTLQDDAEQVPKVPLLATCWKLRMGGGKSGEKVHNCTLANGRR